MNQITQRILISAALSHSSVFDPVPPSADANAKLGDFCVGSKIVWPNPKLNTQVRFYWGVAKPGETLTPKVCKVVRIFPDTGKLLVSPERGEYTNLDQSQIRLATNKEIELDARLRLAEKARMQLKINYGVEE